MHWFRDEVFFINTFDKLADFLDNTANVEVLQERARRCVFTKILDKKELHGGNRGGRGPSPIEYRFTSHQFEVIAAKITALITKYAQAPWDSDLIAQDLVYILQGYLDEVLEELQRF